MSPNRPSQKPYNPKAKPDAVVNAVAPAVHQANPLPANKLGDDLIERAMREHVEGPCDLGPEIPVERPVDLDEPSRVLKFPGFWKRWAGRQTEQSLAAIDRLSRREMRREVVREVLVENWKRMLAVGGLVWAAFQWGVDALIWLGEKLPAAAAAWRALQHGPPT